MNSLRSPCKKEGVNNTPPPHPIKNINSLRNQYESWLISLRRPGAWTKIRRICLVEGARGQKRARAVWTKIPRAGPAGQNFRAPGPCAQKLRGPGGPGEPSRAEPGRLGVTEGD
jgi:hypothetical protein